MTAIMFRRPALLAICLVLSACSLADLNLRPTKPAELFARGFDQYLETEDLTGLALLTEQYPQGAWHDRAEGLIKIVEQQRRQKDLLQEQQRQLGLLQTEKEALLEDNRILQVTLERLKQALIDMERRQK